jgi:hypothetical protein
MARHSRKLNKKATRINQPGADTKKKIAKKTQKQSRWRSWLLSTLMLTTLFSSAGVIIAAGWISILFIFNPEQVRWLNEFLPTWEQVPVNKKDIPKPLQKFNSP